MSAGLYKIIHITSILLVFMSLGALVARQWFDEETDTSKSLRKYTGLLHGIGLVIALVAGFGLLAKLNLAFGGWLIVKLVIWLLIGGMIAFINKNPALKHIGWWSSLILGVIAISMAVLKPF